MEQLTYRTYPVSTLEMNAKNIIHPWAIPGLKRQLMIKDVATAQDKKNDIAFEQILNACLNGFELEISQIAHESRQHYSLQCRQAIYFFCCLLTDMKLKKIADSIPGKRGVHHATVIHGRKAIRNLIDTQDQVYYPIILSIAQALNCDLNAA